MKINEMSNTELLEATSSFTTYTPTEARAAYLANFKLFDQSKLLRSLLGLQRIFNILIQNAAENGSRVLIVKFNTKPDIFLSEATIGADPNILWEVFSTSPYIQNEIYMWLTEAGYIVFQTQNEFVVRW